MQEIETWKLLNMKMDKLPVFAILTESIKLPFQRWKRILSATWLYLLFYLIALVLPSLLSEEARPFLASDLLVYYLKSLFYEIVCSIPLFIMAIRCHRFFLLPEDVAREKIIKFNRQNGEVTFIFYWVLIYLYSLLGVIPMIVIISIVPRLESNWVFFFIFLLPSAYLFSRLSLALPHIALARKPSLSQAWEESKEQSLRLLVVLFIVPVGVSTLIGSSVINTSLINSSLFTYFMTTFIGVLEVCALSLSYKWIKECKYINIVEEF